MKIKKDDYYMLLGLKMMAKNYNKKLDDLYNSAKELLNDVSDEWISDFIYCEDTNVEDLFEANNIELED